MTHFSAVRAGQITDFVNATQTTQERPRVLNRGPRAASSSGAGSVSAPQAHAIGFAQPIDAISGSVGDHDSVDADDTSAQAQRSFRLTVIHFRRTLAQVNEEKDRLLHHIGLRTLSNQTDDSGFDPAKLEDIEDQRFVSRLFETVRKDVHRTFERLNETERDDLESLDACANLAQVQRAAEEQCVAAVEREATLRASAEKQRKALASAIERTAGPLAALADAQPRSPFLHSMGWAFVLVSLLSVGLMTAFWNRLGVAAPVALTTALITLGGGIALMRDPVARRTRLRSMLRALSVAVEETAENLKLAGAETARVQRLMKHNATQLNKEQSLAAAILRRRPQLLRYATREALGPQPFAKEASDEPQVAKPAPVWAAPKRAQTPAHERSSSPLALSA